MGCDGEDLVELVASEVGDVVGGEIAGSTVCDCGEEEVEGGEYWRGGGGVLLGL